MGDVIKFNPAADPNVVLQEATGQFNEVLILGFDENGALDARASSGFKYRDILFAIETFKFKLIRGDYSDDQ